MSASIVKRLFPLTGVGFLLTVSSSGISTEAIQGARRFYASQEDPLVLNVYNSADYIAEDEKDENGNLISKGLIAKFEDFCLDHGRNVRVAYSTFDTNETMLGELRTGKVSYDLVCPSDYVIQKMIREKMIVPFDSEPTDFTRTYAEDATSSTPNYDANVSRWINVQMGGIDVDGVRGLVTDYARGYMWGTLGILYNDQYAGSLARGISPEQMDRDMQDWRSLWSETYNNLLAIKDSMRDTYAVGILYTFIDELEDLKNRYTSGTLSEDDYHRQVNAIFNRSDDETLEKVRVNLEALKANAFGFEVDSGKVDMAQGNKFAINIAWSGDAAYAMGLAKENNEANEERGIEDKTVLKYALPSVGANVWFDGWVMPSAVESLPGHKEMAEAFVDFISMPENVIQNMDYIGYTSVIAGDEVLDYVKGNNDLRYSYDDDDNLVYDDGALNGLSEVTGDAVITLDDEAKESSYYVKDINYFFHDTLQEHDEADTEFMILAADQGGVFDSQYPEQSQLASLCIMADFGSQTERLLTMWEKVKNTNLPLWAYILIIVIIIGIIAFFVIKHIRRRAVLKRRRERKHLRQEKTKKAIEQMKAQEKAVKKENEARIKANKELKKQAKSESEKQ